MTSQPRPDGWCAKHWRRNVTGAITTKPISRPSGARWDVLESQPQATPQPNTPQRKKSDFLLGAPDHSVDVADEFLHAFPLEILISVQRIVTDICVIVAALGKGGWR